MASRQGRRPGDSGTRAAVIAAARRSFAEAGYAATTIRRVAADAGVDPSLVMQYHGSKRGLFLDAMSLPFDTGAAVEQIAAGPRREVGARLARFLATAWEDPVTRSVILGRARAAATEPEGAALVRAQIADDLVYPLVVRLGSDRPELRSGLVSTSLIGMIMARWVIEIEALSGMDFGRLAVYLAPILQRHLVEPLPA